MVRRDLVAVVLIEMKLVGDPNKCRIRDGRSVELNFGILVTIRGVFSDSLRCSSQCRLSITKQK